MEKFALLNLLKVLEGLSAPKNTGNNDAQNDIPTQKPPEEKIQNTSAPHPETYVNVMSSVLVRHEQIANRIKNTRK